MLGGLDEKADIIVNHCNPLSFGNLEGAKSVIIPIYTS